MVSFVVKSALWCQFCPHGFNSPSPVNHFINTSPFISLPQLSQNQHLQTAPHECENKHFQTLSFHTLMQMPGDVWVPILRVLQVLLEDFRYLTHTTWFASAPRRAPSPFLPSGTI